MCKQCGVSCRRAERAEMGRDVWQGRSAGVALGGGGEVFFFMVFMDK